MQLTKSLVPLFRWCGNERFRIATHDLAIVTSIIEKGEQHRNSTYAQLPPTQEETPAQEPVTLEEEHHEEEHLEEHVEEHHEEHHEEQHEEDLEEHHEADSKVCPKVLSGRRAALIHDMGQRTGETSLRTC